MPIDWTKAKLISPLAPDDENGAQPAEGALPAAPIDWSQAKRVGDVTSAPPIGEPGFFGGVADFGRGLAIGAFLLFMYVAVMSMPTCSNVMST